MSDIYDLMHSPSQERKAKMFHALPSFRVVEREVYILEKVTGKVVLDIGATGPMHEAIKQCARKVYGIDIIEKDDPLYYRVDIDRAETLPKPEALDIVIAGEVIEHLSNAGHFLDLLHGYDCPIVLTTPNAFSSVGAYWVGKDIENVNKEHVCYYSYNTLSVLLERHGFEILDFAWYNGKHTSPQLAEGMVCLISKKTR